MIDFFKNLIAERIVIKIFGFIFAIGIIPIMIFLYGLDEEPSWVQENKHYLKYDYAITIKAPLKLFNLKLSKQTLQTKAKKEFKQEIYNRALKQIKKSYSFDTLDTKIQRILTPVLDKEIKALNLTSIKEESIYEDNLHFEIYGLYSMKSAEIDTILQGIYTNINNKMLELNL